MLTLMSAKGGYDAELIFFVKARLTRQREKQIPYNFIISVQQTLPSSSLPIKRTQTIVVFQPNLILIAPLTIPHLIYIRT